MKAKLLLAACASLLVACAESDYKIPTSTTDPPPPNAAIDQHCMQDCLGQGSNPDFCHDRCAK